MLYWIGLDETRRDEKQIESNQIETIIQKNNDKIPNLKTVCNKEASFKSWLTA